MHRDYPVSPVWISIHALCEEGDLDQQQKRKSQSISIHALCEEGDVIRFKLSDGEKISIHALCEEGDRRFCCWCLLRWYFYPRPLRGGRRPL